MKHLTYAFSAVYLSFKKRAKGSDTPHLNLVMLSGILVAIHVMQVALVAQYLGWFSFKNITKQLFIVTFVFIWLGTAFVTNLMFPYQQVKEVRGRKM